MTGSCCPLPGPIGGSALTDANPALTATLRIDVGVDGVVGVAVRAVSLSCVDGRETPTAERILSVSYEFKVLHVDALPMWARAAITTRVDAVANVVELKTIRNWAMNRNPCSTMSKPPPIDQAVPVPIEPSGPRLTRGHQYLHATAPTSQA